MLHAVGAICVLAPALLPSLPSLAVRHEPFVALEHVNLNAGAQWNAELQRFWFHILGAADDPRGAQVASETSKAGGSMKGLRWANFGLQQFHLPVGEPDDPVQRLRGEMALVYTAEELELLRLRLERAGVPFERLPDGALRSRCPFGNLIRLEAWPSERAVSWFGPAPTMDPRVERPLPGGASRGLGLRWVRFDVPRGAAEPICRFYTQYFGAAAHLDDEDGRLACRVPIGYEQRLDFVEQREGAPPLARYDGHHIALYVNRFDEIYGRLAASNLVWNNPRFPQLTYDTLDDARKHNEFRILQSTRRGVSNLQLLDGASPAARCSRSADRVGALPRAVVNPESGEVVYTLEHEVEW